MKFQQPIFNSDLTGNHIALRLRKLMSFFAFTLLLSFGISLCPYPILLALGPMACLSALSGILALYFALRLRLFSLAFLLCGLTVLISFTAVSGITMLIFPDELQTINECLNNAITHNGLDSCYTQFHGSMLFNITGKIGN